MCVCLCVCIHADSVHVCECMHTCMPMCVLTHGHASINADSFLCAYLVCPDSAPCIVTALTQLCVAIFQVPDGAYVALHPKQRLPPFNMSIMSEKTSKSYSSSHILLHCQFVGNFSCCLFICLNTSVWAPEPLSRNV